MQGTQNAVRSLGPSLMLVLKTQIGAERQAGTVETYQLLAIRRPRVRVHADVSCTKKFQIKISQRPLFSLIRLQDRIEYDDTVHSSSAASGASSVDFPPPSLMMFPNEQPPSCTPLACRSSCINSYLQHTVTPSTRTEIGETALSSSSRQVDNLSQNHREGRVH